jgi:hypothetical protein
MAGERKKFCIPCCQKFCMLVAKNSVFLFAKNSVFLFTDHTEEYATIKQRDRESRVVELIEKIRRENPLFVTDLDRK